MDLKSLAKQCESFHEFIGAIQKDGLESKGYLLDAVYKWESETLERAKKYKNVGWFGIATDFWEENK